MCTLCQSKTFFVVLVSRAEDLLFWLLFFGSIRKILANLRNLNSDRIISIFILKGDNCWSKIGKIRSFLEKLHFLVLEKRHFLKLPRRRRILTRNYCRLSDCILNSCSMLFLFFKRYVVLMYIYSNVQYGNIKIFFLPFLINYQRSIPFSAGWRILIENII